MMNKNRRLIPILAALAVLLLFLGMVRADSPNRAGLVVVYDGGDVVKKCIEFSGNKISGEEMLNKADLDFKVDASNPMGVIVCKIEGTGCDYPKDDCFCECPGSPCIYWSYWYREDGDWEYSTKGASILEAGNGDVQGWVWGEGQIGSSGNPPPDVSFEDICVPPTDTPTPVPTDTPTPLPTDTPTPVPTDTPTPVPTETPTPTEEPDEDEEEDIDEDEEQEPESTPVIHHFSADKSTIQAGESAVLSWDLSEATAAYLRYGEVEEGIISPGSKTVSPGQTTAYTLVAVNDEGGEALTELTITVSEASEANEANEVNEANEAAQAAAVVETAPTPTPAPAQSQAAPPTPTPTPPPSTPTPVPPSADDPPPAQNQADSPPLPTPTPPPPASPTPQPLISPTPQPLISPTPAELAMRITPLPDSDDGDRRFRVDQAEEAGADQTLKRLFLYGGVSLALALFLGLPIVLLVAGWLTWWLRKR